MDLQRRKRRCAADASGDMKNGRLRPSIFHRKHIIYNKSNPSDVDDAFILV